MVTKTDYFNVLLQCTRDMVAYVTRYEKIDHLQKLLNSKYRLTKSGYGEYFFYQLFIPTGIGINNLSSIAVPNFSPLTPL